MVRSFRPEDLPVIMEIGRNAFREGEQLNRQVYGEELYELLPKEEIDEEIGDFIAKATKEHCERWPDMVYVYEEDGKVVGYVVFYLHRETGVGEIGINALIPEYQGKGLAQQMYKAVLDRFRQKGMRYARVDTGLDLGSEPARKAYERAGFNIRSGEINYYMKL